MMLLDDSYRTLVKKYVPQITPVDLERHERLLAWRHHVHLEANFLPAKVQQTPDERRRVLMKQSQQILHAVNEVMVDYDTKFKAIDRLWQARKRYALEQGCFLQIPSSPKALLRLIKVSIAYNITAARTLPVLWYNQLVYFFKYVTFSS